MAGRIKGITVEIGGDTRGLSNALTGVNKEIKHTQSQLKDVERLLKLDPTNTNLLQQRQKLLAKSVEETRDKLTSLKEAEKQVQQQVAEGKVSQEQYEGLQREIIATEQQLKNLKKECKDFGSVFTQQMKVAGEKVQEVGDKISAVGEKVGDAGKKLLPATTAIVAAGTAAFLSASDMAESQNKVEVAFGSSSEKVKEFAETTLDAYGIASGTSMDMAALFGDMATSMQITEEKAADMSMTLVGLAGDLSSYKNVSLETASNALKGIFTGETESLKSLGIVMTQDNLLRYAMKNGMINTAKTAEQLAKEEIALEKAQVAYNKAVQKYGSNSLQAREAAIKMSDAEAKLNESAKASLDTLSQEEMVQLRYAYVLNATKNAQGDFARTSDGTANSIRIMKESLKEASAAFGELLLPIITPIIQKITEVVKWITSLDESQKKTILTVAAVVAAVGPALIILGKIITVIGSITSAIGFLIAHPIVLLIAAIVALVALIATKGDEIQAILQKVDDFLQGVFATDWTTVFGPVLGSILNGFFADLKNIWDSIMQVFNGVIDFIRGVFTGNWERAWNGVKEIFGGVFNGLIALARGPINSVIGFINAAIGAVNTLIGGLNRIPGVNVGRIGTIPMLANGGTVWSGSAIVGDAGPELLTVAGGKAVVQPLTNNTTTHNATNLGGVTLNVYGAPGQDVHELAEILMDEFQHVYEQREAAPHG